MNEQEITSAVQAVLDQMKEAAPQHTHKHVCKCKKHQMTLKLANALIEKVKAELLDGLPIFKPPKDAEVNSEGTV